MPKAMHIIDRETCEDSLRQLQELAREDEIIVSAGPPPRSWVLDRRVLGVPRPFGYGRLAGRRMKHLAGGADLIHAWSLSSIAAAELLAVECDLPLVLSASFCEKGLAPHCRALGCRVRSFGVTVPTVSARAALLAQGLPEKVVNVLPPPAPPIDDRDARRRRVREELGIGDHQRLIVVPTEMRRYRGHRIASWAHAIVRKVVDDHLLLLPGGGPFERHVRFFAATTGHDDEVFFTERRYSPAEVLAASDLAAIFCERDGGVGALVAAMSAGLAILASRTPGVSEVAPHEEAALLAEPASPRSAAAALLRMLDDDALAKRLSQNARRKAEQNFQPAACREKLESIYASLRSMTTA